MGFFISVLMVMYYDYSVLSSCHFVGLRMHAFSVVDPPFGPSSPATLD